MQKERRIKGLSIVALLIAVVGLTIAFAAMNRTLNINNTTAKVGKFNVKFVSDSSNFPPEKNYEYKYMGDEGTGDETNLTNSVISNYGATVSGLHPVFNMTGITARYILKIHNDSASRVKVNQIVLPQECDNAESDKIVCSLKNLGSGYNKTIEQIDVSSNVEVNNTTIEAGESIYVSFNVYAKEDDTLIGQEQEYPNLTLSMTFVQAEASVSQDSPDNPIIIDDTDTYYNIELNDLTKINWNNVDINMQDGDFNILLLKNSQNVYAIFTISYNYGNYSIHIGPNIFEATEYQYYSNSNSWSGDVESGFQPPSFYGYKILSYEETATFFQEMGEEEPFELMNEDTIDLLFNIMPLN